MPIAMTRSMGIHTFNRVVCMMQSVPPLSFPSVHVLVPWLLLRPSAGEGLAWGRVAVWYTVVSLICSG